MPLQYSHSIRAVWPLSGLYRLVNTIAIYAILIFNAAAQAPMGEPPRVGSNDGFDQNVSLLTNREFSLSIAVLIFGLIIIIIEYRLLSRVAATADELLRVLTVTMIIVVSLTLVSSAYGKDQITPVLALFGTIIGYLLGSAKGTRESSDEK